MTALRGDGLTCRDPAAVRGGWLLGRTGASG